MQMNNYNKILSIYPSPRSTSWGRTWSRTGSAAPAGGGETSAAITTPVTAARERIFNFFLGNFDKEKKFASLDHGRDRLVAHFLSVTIW